MSGVRDRSDISRRPRLTFFALCFTLSCSLWIPLVIFVRPPPRRVIQRSLSTELGSPERGDGPICQEYWLP